MDDGFAGFAGAKTGHRRVVLCRRPYFRIGGLLQFLATLVSLVAFATHARVEGKPVGLGHPFQPWVRARACPAVSGIQWPDGADHERLLTLLWADGDPVRHGIAQEMRHGIRIVCGIEIQPGTLGILLQQALPFQATAYSRPKWP